MKNFPHLALVAIWDEEDEESALYEAALYYLGLNSACWMTKCAAGIHERVMLPLNGVLIECDTSRSLFEKMIPYKILSGRVQPR